MFNATKYNIRPFHIHAFIMHMIRQYFIHNLNDEIQSKNPQHPPQAAAHRLNFKPSTRSTRKHKSIRGYRKPNFISVDRAMIFFQHRVHHIAQHRRL